MIACIETSLEIYENTRVLLLSLIHEKYENFASLLELDTNLMQVK